MALRLGVLIAALLLVAVGCRASTADPESRPDTGTDAGPTAETSRTAEPLRDAVLYTIGLSTDPYGDSRPRGVGVATGVAAGRVEMAEVEHRGLGWFGGAAWLPDGRIVAPRKPLRHAPPFRPPAVFRVADGRLDRLGLLRLQALEWAAHWSPDGGLVATEPVEIVDCGKGRRPALRCWRGGEAIYVARADGSERRKVTAGHLGGWTPDGRLLVTDDDYAEYRAVDPHTGEAAPVIRGEDVARLAGVRRAGVGKPVWSADGRYIAAYAGVAWPKRSGITNAVVIATADGRPLRFLTSRYLISMLAWSPTGHRLAWTTSGFPDPHELFVLDEPRGDPRRLFATAARHFDWVTWSPDGRFVLLDDEHSGRRGRWLLLDASTGERVRTLPRFGGAPQWCCPAARFGRDE